MMKLSMIDNMPPKYTYLIGWRTLDVWYYGVRLANKVSPEDDLWKIYRTSSKHVHAYAAQHGDPDVIRVHRTFETREAAVESERRFLWRVKADIDIRWLNRNISGRPMGGTPEQLQSVRGRKDTPEQTENRRQRTIGANNPMFGKTGELHPLFGKPCSEERKQRISESVKERLKTHPHVRTGRTHSEETKRKISEARKGVTTGPRSEETRAKLRGRIKTQEETQKLSESLKARFATQPHHLKGVPKSEETRKRMSEARKRFYAEKHAAKLAANRVNTT